MQDEDKSLFLVQPLQDPVQLQQRGLGLWIVYARCALGDFVSVIPQEKKIEALTTTKLPPRRVHGDRHHVAAQAARGTNITGAFKEAHKHLRNKVVHVSLWPHRLDEQTAHQAK